MSKPQQVDDKSETQRQHESSMNQEEGATTCADTGTVPPKPPTNPGGGVTNVVPGNDHSLRSDS